MSIWKQSKGNHTRVLVRYRSWDVHCLSSISSIKFFTCASRFNIADYSNTVVRLTSSSLSTFSLSIIPSYPVSYTPFTAKLQLVTMQSLPLMYAGPPTSSMRSDCVASQLQWERRTRCAFCCGSKIVGSGQWWISASFKNRCFIECNQID